MEKHKLKMFALQFAVVIGEIIHLLILLSYTKILILTSPPVLTGNVSSSANKRLKAANNAVKSLNRYCCIKHKIHTAVIMTKTREIHLSGQSGFTKLPS